MKTIHTTYFFASSSSGATYQTLFYDDASLSCDCKGWTRRVAPDGSRSCKHTRLVAAGLGEREALKVVVHSRAALPGRRPQTSRAPEGIDEATTRRFDFT